MPIDLTRFDFHVHRFMNSPDVERMSAAEVGQYILLLCKSWANGDECLLPADKSYLNRIARAKPVADLVLSKFEVVWVPLAANEEPNPQSPEGQPASKRLRNHALYEEWCAAKKRSKVAEDKANKRWEPEPKVNAGAHATASAAADAGKMPNPVQSIHPSIHPSSKSGGMEGQKEELKSGIGDLLDEVNADVTLAEQAPGGAIGPMVSQIPVGQPGHYHRGQYLGTKPEAIFKHLSAAWIRAKGLSA